MYALTAMKEFYALHLCGIVHDLGILETALHTIIRDQGPALPVSEALLVSAIDDAKNAVAACSPQEGMRPATEAAQRLLKHLTNLPRQSTCAELETEARHLHQMIFAELRREKAISIPRRYHSYVDNDAAFGTAVRDAFLGAKSDIRDAGNALSVGLSTAAIFHLMRAVEVGLRALAKERQVALPQGRQPEFAEWQELITAIRRGVDATFGQWKRATRRQPPWSFMAIC